MFERDRNCVSREFGDFIRNTHQHLSGRIYHVLGCGLGGRDKEIQPLVCLVHRNPGIARGNNHEGVRGVDGSREFGAELCSLAIGRRRYGKGCRRACAEIDNDSHIVSFLPNNRILAPSRICKSGFGLGQNTHHIHFNTSFKLLAQFFCARSQRGGCYSHGKNGTE